MRNNRICQLFGIQYPLIQAGMVWASGWRLAAAVSEAGGLGILGAGSMHPETLENHIQKLKAVTNKPFGVNLPLLYPEMELLIDVLIREQVPIVFTSAGNPRLWTSFLKDRGCTVIHVVSSVSFALKAIEAGVDGVVAEGFEAGGHNGREETTTMTLLPLVRKSISAPLIAAGGIATGEAMLAAFALGAEAVQVGSRFVASLEASCHEAFKKKVIDSGEGSTELTLKELTPVRLLKNSFYEQVKRHYAEGAKPEILAQLLGKGRAKKGMFEGDLEEGELEIGQVAALIDTIIPASAIVEEMLSAYNTTLARLQQIGPIDL
ncbi:MAG TPA: nitronate monooxygenase [Flavobacteriaceae bacterium]|nr:nitronate monooxygenase [Flavobacteriaceae bacterium]|tara:strand:+ start:13554 stop:14513 length:960 start_codon:yes stop_codon:yes gene_type:complete